MTTVYGSEWQRVQPPPVTEDSCTDVWGPLGRYVAENQQISKMNVFWYRLSTVHNYWRLQVTLKNVYSSFTSDIIFCWHILSLCLPLSYPLYFPLPV